MLPVMFKNSWFPTMFEDFLNSDIMPRTNTTAPAVNVREDEKAYTMEVAAPGIKKEFCRVSINDEGNLCLSAPRVLLRELRAELHPARGRRQGPHRSQSGARNPHHHPAESAERGTQTRPYHRHRVIFNQSQ